MLRTAFLPLVLATLSAQGPQTPANGGFEATDAREVGKSRSHAFYTVEGWRTKAGAWAAQTGVYYKVRAHDGQRFLRPRARDGARCELQQDVAIPAFGATRPRALLTKVYMRTGIGKDRTEVVFEMLDEDGTVLSGSSSQPQSDTEWTAYHSLLRVPTTARSVRIRLIGHHVSGKITDAFFDAVQLQGVGPGHPQSLADKSAADLISEHSTATDPARRKRLLVALAGTDNKGATYLSQLLRKESRPDNQAELLRLLLISGQKAAARPVEQALTGSDLARRAVLQNLDLAAPDLAGKVAMLASKETEHCMEYLEALAIHGVFQKLNALFGMTRSKSLRLSILKALQKGSFTAQVLNPILSTNLHASGHEDQRYQSMKLLAATGSARYLKVLETVCKAEASLTRRGHYFRWAAGYDSVDAVKAMLPLVSRQVERCRGAFLEWAPTMPNAAVGDWMRRAGASNRDPLLRRTAIAWMRQNTTDLALLLKLTGDPQDSVATAAITALSGVEGAGPRLRALVKSGSGARAGAAMAALKSDPDPAVTALAVKAAQESKHWRVRVAAIAALARDAKQHHELLCACLTHPARQVRTAAIQALVGSREKRAIEVLLTRLDQEHSTTRAFVAEALVSLTGVDKGHDARLWRTWWSAVRSDFVVPAAAPKAMKARGAGATIATFFDVPVQTDNIVFVIDVSGSMKTEVRGDTKLATAKDEVIKVLRAMAKGPRRFNIITFGTQPQAYHKALQRATPDNIRKAISWLKRLEPKGWTNIHDSVLMAMDMSGVESIFLLSDGAPSSGEYVGMSKVRDTIAARNRSMMIRINTIAVGGDKRSRSFMKKLAEENFGKNRDHN